MCSNVPGCRADGLGISYLLPVESTMDPVSFLHSAERVCKSSIPVVLAVGDATLVVTALKMIC